MDLHCLTLEAQAWRLAAEGDCRAARLLSRAHQVHAMAVSFRGDPAGGQASGGAGDGGLARVVPAGADLVLLRRAGGAGLHGGRLALGRTSRGARRCAPCGTPSPGSPTPPGGGLEVWMLSETAICLTQEGATEEALAVGAEGVPGGRSQDRPRGGWRCERTHWPGCC